MFVAVSRYCSSIKESVDIIGKRLYYNPATITRTRAMTTKSSPPDTQVSTPATYDKHDNRTDQSQRVDVPPNLLSFCKLVKLDTLTDDEKLIHNKHLKALQNQQEMYEDPATGYSVLTRFAHLKRGHCCGNACRHCPYGQTAVPENIPRKTYNSAFFV